MPSGEKWFIITILFETPNSCPRNPTRILQKSLEDCHGWKLKVDIYLWQSFLHSETSFLWQVLKLSLRKGSFVIQIWNEIHATQHRKNFSGYLSHTFGKNAQLSACLTHLHWDSFRTACIDTSFWIWVCAKTGDKKGSFGVPRFQIVPICTTSVGFGSRWSLICSETKQRSSSWSGRRVTKQFGVLFVHTVHHVQITGQNAGGLYAWGTHRLNPILISQFEASLVGKSCWVFGWIAHYNVRRRGGVWPWAASPSEVFLLSLP